LYFEQDSSMTEITRVPLQPIAKGAMGKLWLGVVAAIAVGGGLAWATAPEIETLEGGVQLITVKAGEGASPKLSDVALINYKGTLDDGTVFDQNEQTPLPLQGVIPGFTTALQNMEKGGKYKVRIPSEVGYGAQGQGPIPPNSDLNFDIELIDFVNFEQFQQQMMIQQMMQQQQQGGAQGMPPGAPGQ
jgi:FKBP-type peptidyl-prolyl cis-trans isomerase FkpA